jgi:YidC/Oxa1 family membrane protein insertase
MARTGIPVDLAPHGERLAHPTTEDSMIDKVLAPLEWVVAWLMVSFHTLFSAIGLPAASGITWALSIVGLVIVIRIVLIPLFVKQIHASRRMQLIQPEMQKIQKKYKGKTDTESRQAMTQETMGLYKRTGTNPFSSCLPILLQSPIFFALFRVLNNLSPIATGKHPPIGPLDAPLAFQAEHSTIFGASLSSTFVHAGGSLNTQIVTVVLIIAMSVTTFTTQRQLMMKNMPANALDNPFAKQQKVLLYLMPLFFAFSGINFPIGVLLYWLTTNVWSMCQQFYTIRRMPAPGSPAEKALEARRLKSGKEHKKFTIPGLSHDSAPQDITDIPDIQDTPVADTKPKSGQRQQPKRKNRAKPVARADGAPGPTPTTDKPGGAPDPKATTPANGRPGVTSGAGSNGGSNGKSKGVESVAGSKGHTNGRSPGVRPATGSNGKSNGVESVAGSNGASNGKSPDVKPAAGSNGSSPTLKPPATADDSS